MKQNDMLIAINNWVNRWANETVLEAEGNYQGPRPALYGSNAFHGVLSLNTRNPGKDTSEIVVEHGSLKNFAAARY